QTDRGEVRRCGAVIRSAHRPRSLRLPFSFLSDFATSRAHSIKSLVTGLRVRFFKVMIPTGQTGMGSITGNTFTRGIFAPSRSIESGKVAKIGSLASNAEVR